MTSSDIDVDQRAFLASLSTDDAEKVINNSADAQLALPGEAIIKVQGPQGRQALSLFSNCCAIAQVFFAVMPMSDDEIAAQTAVCASWRIRRAAQATRREAVANMVIVPPDGDEDGPMDMDMDIGHGEEAESNVKKPRQAGSSDGATLTQTAAGTQGTLPMPQLSQDDNFLGDDEMAAIAAAEDAAAERSAKKRDRPQTPASVPLKEEPAQEAAHAAAKKRPKPAGDAAGAKSPPPAAGAPAKKVAKRPVQKVQ